MKKNIIILIIGIIVASFLFFFDHIHSDKVRTNLWSESIKIDSKEIFNNDNQLRLYVKKFGPAQAVKRLNELSGEFGLCHHSAHKAGRFSYELLGEQAFRQCGPECQSGCYHGATEGYFRDNGTANLAQQLKVICGSELNIFFNDQCLHGIGHGLMAWANYDLPGALKSCDLLDQGRESCYTGVFMENITGALSEKESKESKLNSVDHITKYLNDDPLFPCNIVEGKYVKSCYVAQTDQMLRLFKDDFSKVAKTCRQISKEYWQACFQSMGRDVGGRFYNDIEKAVKTCSYAGFGENRTDCLVGAVQDLFWDSSGQDKAISFCSVLNNLNEKDRCHGMIIGRAIQVLDDNGFKIFCHKLEVDRIEGCLNMIN